VESTPPQAEHASLSAYWRGLGVCLVLTAIYIAVIMALGTETARRSTAPPWYAWIRLPKVHTRPGTIFLVLPALVFAGWMVVIRRCNENPLSAAMLLPLACAAVLAMNATMAMTDGSAGAIAKPFNWPGSESFSDVGYMHGIRNFLASYVHNLYRYSIHTRTHPPGAVLFLYLVGRMVAPGLTAAAWSAVAVTATAAIPFALLARRIGGERIGLLALAMYVVAPSLVIYGATSMDGVFLASLLWSMYLLYRVVDRPGIAIAVVAGIALAISFSLTYAAVCVVCLMLIYAAMELMADGGKFPRMALSLTLCGLIVVAWFAVIYLWSGFNYLACLSGSRFYDHYAMRTSSMTFGRYLDISFCNLVALLTGVGFAALVLWWKQTVRSLKSIRGWTKLDRFNAAGVICVVGFSFARLFTHETERIWLFFIPPALLAAAGWIVRAEKETQRPLLEWTMGLMFAQTWLMQMLLFTIW
jgi:Dolichyl-phosphate-mannose-protein mannosyltransferase